MEEQKPRSKKFIALAVIVLALIGLGVWYMKDRTSDPTSSQTSQPIENSQAIQTSQTYQPPKTSQTVVYNCKGGQSITATYHEREETLLGTVDVKLSGAGVSTLKRTISDDGTRYSDGNPQIPGNERFVFWSKDNEAIILRNNQLDPTFVNCVSAPN